MTAFVDSPALTSAWYLVAESGDIGSDPHAVRLLARDFVIWRGPGGSLVGAPDRCPHRESPLSIGTISDGILTCAYHGWSFGADGRCVSVPSSRPGASIPPAAHLSCVHLEERYGLVWMCPGEPSDEPCGQIPLVSYESNPAFRRINTGVGAWAVSAPRMVDNFLDISHFPWVHTGTFGAGQASEVALIELGDLGDGWYGYSYEVNANNPDQASATSGSTDAVVRRQMTTGFHLPFTIRGTIKYEHGLEHVLLLCSTPVDDTNSLFTFVVWRNDNFSIDPQEAVAFDREIGAEDKRMLEQLSGTMPLGQTGLANVQSDRPSVEWRRRFAELVGVGG
jgi:phenylpropionate dioxygenase-like ring-hydroxylating dioxygenase large terminal subunit